MSQQQDRLYHFIQFGIMINWVWTVEETNLFSCIKSNQIPMYQTVNKEIMGPLPKPGPLSDCWCMWELNKWWGLSGGKITEENLQILSSHGFQDNRRFPCHVFSFIQLPAPFTSPTTTSLFHVFQTMHTFMLRSSKHSLLPYLNNSKGINEHFNLITLDIWFRK